MKIVLTKEEQKVLSDLFQHPAGEEARLLIERKFCNVNNFDKNPYQNAYNDGHRGLALMLCACAAITDSEVVGTEHLDMRDIDNTSM